MVIRTGQCLNMLLVSSPVAASADAFETVSAVKNVRVKALYKQFIKGRYQTLHRVMYFTVCSEEKGQHIRFTVNLTLLELSLVILLLSKSH